MASQARFYLHPSPSFIWTPVSRTAPFASPASARATKTSTIHPRPPSSKSFHSPWSSRAWIGQSPQVAF